MCHHVHMAKKPQYFREWRKHRGLTQEQLAERIGITRSYLTKIERGDRRYDQPFLEAAAEALRCDPGDLITRDASQPESIWTIWDQLEPHERVQATVIIRALKGAANAAKG